MGKDIQTHQHDKKFFSTTKVLKNTQLIKKLIFPRLTILTLKSEQVGKTENVRKK